MNWKKLGKQLLFPPTWFLLFLSTFSAAALVYVFINGWHTLVVAYVFYVMAFYSLTVSGIACVMTFPNYYKSIRSKLYGNQYSNRYLTDRVFKMHVNLYRSLVVNVLYVAVNAGSAIVYRTHWFAIFAVYYGILALMRILLVHYVGKHQIGADRLKELKRARLCSYILLTVNFVLTGAVLMMVYFQRGFEYHGVLIYVMALYTFYTTINAVVDIIRFRKFRSPIMSVSGMIKLAAALVSMLPLETAMFAQFGAEMPMESQKIMIMTTGGGISIIVIAMAMDMIVRTSKEMREHA